MAKVYISGKITGLKYEEAFDVFEKAELDVKNLGGIPINPMKKIPFNPEWKWEQYMEKAISLLFESEGVYMLKNWGNSKGARIEYAIAKEMNIKILFQG